VVQLVLKGLPHHKPKHTVGTDTIGLDLGPASLAIVPLCAELRPDARAIRRLQRKMERQRRAANPELYDERGRPKKRAKGAARWKESRSYQASRRRKATRERKLAAHRKSLHGRLAHQIVAVGHTIVTEKISYRGWQKRYGKSVGRCAPGMLIDHLKRTGVSYGRHPARGSHSFHQTLPVLSWLREGCQKAAVAALAPVPLWRRAGAARSVLCVSGRLS
jgi:transposase